MRLIHSTGRLSVMRKYNLISLTILVLLIATLALNCTAKADPAAANQVATVQRGNLNINILASGNLATAREENLAFYSAGTVQEVLVKIGDRVESGKELAKLDTATLEISLTQAQINVEKARLNLSDAVSGNNGKAPDPLNIESMEQDLKISQANLAVAEKLLQQATIVAPFAGLVAEVNVVPGDQVSASTVAVRLIDSVNFQTDVLVNEIEVYQLSIGTPATVQAVALPSYTFPAKISLIAETPTISSNVVNYKVTVQLDPVDAATMQSQATQRVSSGSASARTRPSGAGGQTAGTQLSGAASDNRTFSRQAYAGQQSDNMTASDNRTFTSPAFTVQPSDNQTASGNRTSTRRSFAGQTPGAAGQNQQVQAPVTVPQDFRLREGLTVTVSIIAEQRTNIILVPNKAITSRGGRYYVQVVSADGKTAEKQIQAGITDGQNTEVISGLSEGDVVSTATNITTTTTTTNSQQQRGGQGNQIPGVRIP